MRTLIRPAVTLFLLMTLITGIMYPLIVTSIANVAFPHQAAGSLIMNDGNAVGSMLIGQHFSDAKHFWSRPSATSPQAYNGLASGGSNLGPLNPALVDVIKIRIDALRTADPDNKAPIPVDLVTASASGLDSDISVAAANYQVSRVARARGFTVADVRTLVDAYAQHRMLGFLGEPQVNALELNLALDSLPISNEK